MAKKRLSHGLWGIAKVVSLAMAGDYVALGSFAGVVQARTGDLCYFLFFFSGRGSAQLGRLRLKRHPSSEGNARTEPA